MPRPTQREEPLQVLARMAEIRKANKRKPHWECEVDVYLQPPGSDPRFHLQTCMETDGDGRIVLRNRRRPGFIIKFRLRNAKHYRFPVDPLAAVWSKRGYVCPEDPIWQIFRPFAVDQKGKTLSVYAENPTPAGGNFEYVLRVRNNNNGSILRLDPGGTENNGASH